MWREKVKRLIFVRADQIIPRRGILMLYSRQLVFTLSFVSLYELYSALFWIYLGNRMDFIRPSLSCHYWLTRTDLAEEARNHAGFATIAMARLWLTGLILRILDLSFATIRKLIVCEFSVSDESWPGGINQPRSWSLEAQSDQITQLELRWMNYDHYTWSLLSN